MKTVFRIQKILIPTAAALMVAAPLAAFAQTTVSANATVGGTVTASMPVASATATTEVRTNTSIKSNGKGATISLTNAKNRGDREIDRRITNLDNLATRINAMKNVTASEKAALQASITSEVNTLTTLKAKIDADTDAATLKTDVQSITKDYRVYMLVIPQGRVIAAADRIETIVADMQALAPKLEARISEAQSAGVDVTAANAAYTDMQAKVADANTQATAAASEVATLTPDQGDSTIKSSNETTLKDAAAKIKAATTDLKAARADVTTILKTVKGTRSVSASTTANAATH